MTTRFRRLTVLVLCAACWLLLAPTAHGAPSAQAPADQTSDLCHHSVPCSVQAAATWQEGTPGEVAVTGAPEVTVDVRAFRVRTQPNGQTTLDEFGPTVEVTTDAHGFGSADLALPELDDEQSAGPLLVALADSSGPDLSKVLGAWTTLVSRRPLVLGDGFATAKPVGVDLSLEIAAADPGTSFDVEIERTGQWESVGTHSPPCTGASTCEVGYEIPRGLDPVTHRARLVNRSTGTAVASWKLLPSDEGRPAERRPVPARPSVGSGIPGTISATDAVPRPRSQSLDVPDIGAHVEGAGTLEEHSPDAVRRAALALAGLAALVALLGVTFGARGRRATRA